MQVELIIPVAKQDIQTAISNIPYIKKYVHPSKIVIITAANVNKSLPTWVTEDKEIFFLDENTLVPGLNFAAIQAYMNKRSAEKRTGWYFQQFLKMAYAFICESDYYISWDADTIPIRDADLFDNNGRPIFSMKTEYNKPYFDTLERLLGMGKVKSGSFIAEHMLFKKEYMLELIQEIEQGSAQPWFFRILDCVDSSVLAGSGFSEFETYGTYVTNRHPDQYTFLDIKAVRAGRSFFGNCPEEPVLNWLAKTYTTVSFESQDRQIIKTELYNHAMFRNIVSPFWFIQACRVYAKLWNRFRGKT